THRLPILSINPAKHFADFTNRALRPYRLYNRRHEIAVCFGYPRKLTEYRSHFLCVATFLSLLQSLCLLFFYVSFDFENRDSMFFRLCISVPAYDDSLPAIGISLICDRSSMNLALRKAALDRFDHASHFIQLVEISLCFGFHPVGQRLQIISPAQRISGVRHSRFMCNDL